MKEEEGKKVCTVGRPVKLELGSHAAMHSSCSNFD